MRRNSLFILGILLLAAGFCGCHGRKDKAPTDILEEMTVKPKMNISAEDTAEVYRLIETYLGLLKSGNVGDAVSSLRSLSATDSLGSLSDEQSRKLQGALQVMSGKTFRVEYLRFNRDYDNEARIKCILFENAPGEKAPNEMSMVLRPVRYEGRWYLTPADDSTRGSEIAK